MAHKKMQKNLLLTEQGTAPSRPNPYNITDEVYFSIPSLVFNIKYAIVFMQRSQLKEQ